jgi:PAS domain S-box-containing protein
MPKKPVRTQRQLRTENEDLRARLAEAEEALHAIRSGQVDALIVSDEGGEQVFTLKGADRVYRMLIEDMNEGALTLTAEGLILYANRRFAEMLTTPLEKIIGSTIHTWIVPDSHWILQTLLRKGGDENSRGELALTASDGTQVPVYLSVNHLSMDGLPNSFCLVATDLTEQKKRNEAIVAAETLARLILEQAAEAIVVCDETGRIIRASKTAQAMCGESPLGQPFERVFPLQRTDGAAFSLADTMNSGDGQRIETGLEGNGQALYLLVSVGSLVGTQNKTLGSVITLTDITANKLAEDGLRAQNMELQILHETSQTILTSRNIQNMAASILDKAIAVSHCDLGVIRLLDRTSMTLDLVASHGYRDPKNLQQHRRHLDDGTTGMLLRIFARKETVVVERVQDEPGLPIFKREGAQSLILIPVLAEHDLLGGLQLGSRTPRKFDPHLINLLETLGSNFGIAVQKNRLLEETLATQAQLRALSRRLVKTQENERQYLARELHDEIGSLLTGLKLTLGGSAASGTDQIDARTAAAYTIIDEALVKTRSLSHSLRPPMLDDLGLLPALSWHIKEFTARANVQVNFQHHDLQGRFPEEVEIAAYRIVQEALTNIARHAQVHEATVTLWADQSGLGIEISDQGAGFEQTATLANASGVGLAGMRERVASLGGSLTITSAPGTGTSVMVELPLATGEKTVRSEQ